jgi:HPt (histidine-containing phosphotransfer) domain-containing protein
MGKPFTSQELWRCLLKFLKPLDSRKENAVRGRQSDDELRQMLIESFLRNNRDKYNEIKEALDTGDIKLAHRMVHTLKSNAGQLNQKLLRRAAEELEKNLKDGENFVTPCQLDILKTELDKSLAEFDK